MEEFMTQEYTETVSEMLLKVTMSKYILMYFVTFKLYYKNTNK